MQINLDFFKTLYRYSETSALELRALPSGKRVFINLDYTDEIEEFCNLNKKENLFFGVALRNGGGTKEHVSQIPALWCDVDYKDTSREIIIQKLKAFPFKPSITVKSGCGIHLYWLLKEPSRQEDIGKVEDINKRIVSQLGGDLNSCDAARILRIPGTVNHKYENKPVCEVVEKEEYYYNLDDFLDTLPAPTPKNHSEGTPTSTRNWLTEAMQGVGKGNRNAVAAKIAGYWINKIAPKEVQIILSTWNLQNNPPLSEKEINTIIKSVSRYEPEKSNTVDISNVYDNQRMLSEYRNYIKSLKQNRFITGIHEIDKRIRGIAGGEVLTIIARAGSFKTAALQNLLKSYINNSSWGAIFFSLEMPIPSITERYCSIVTGASGNDIEDSYTSKLSGAEKFKNEVEKQFLSDLKNLFIIPTKVSISDMVSYVKLIEQNKNIKIGLIGIDYLGLIDSQGKNEYEIISKLSRDIKTMAKTINLPVILLSQVNRKGGEGQTEITLDMGRGSGAVEEGADFVLGLWQAEKQGGTVLEAETEYDLVCKILKNRKGAPGSSWILDLDSSNFRIGADAQKYEPPKRKSKKFDL